MIQEFRTKLYARATGVNQREIDMGDPLWQERIDAQLARDGTLPPKGDPSEYSVAFEALYASPEDRRQYIAGQVRKGTPSIGHRVLGSLLSSGKTHCVFTTNFDSLIEDGAIVAGQKLPAAMRQAVTTAAIDNADRAARCLWESGWPLVAKLHGDYQSVNLKNTANELAEPDAKMRLVLTHACQRFGLIVVGYSGRDASVMNALAAVLRSETPYPGGIHWLCRDQDDLLPAVKSFLASASTAGVDVRVVRGGTFDEFASNLADVVNLPTVLVDHVFGSVQKDAVASVVLSRHAARKAPVLRMSAVPVVSMPTVARRLVLNRALTTREAQSCVDQAGIRAAVAASGNEVAAFGKDDELIRAFQEAGARLDGTLSLHPAKDSWALGLLYDALVRAMCRRKPLFARMSRRGHSIRVSALKEDASAESQQWRKEQLSGLAHAYGAPLIGQPKGLAADYSEGVNVRLDHADGRWWCVFEPATFVELRDISDEAVGYDDTVWSPLRHAVEEWRREQWAQCAAPGDS